MAQGQSLFFTMKVIVTNVATLLEFFIVLMLVLIAFGLASTILRSFTADQIRPSSPGFDPVHP